MLVVASILGWSLCSGALEYERCAPLALPLLVCPMSLWGLIFIVSYLRRRTKSLQQRKHGILFVINVIAALLLAVFTLGGSVYLFLNVLEVDTGSESSDGDGDHCYTDSDSLVGTSIFMCIVFTLLSVWFVFSVVWMVYLRALFIHPPCQVYPLLLGQDDEGGDDRAKKRHPRHQYLHEDAGKSRYIRIPSGHAIPTLMFRHPSATHTIIYSHGNACDLDDARYALRNMAKVLKVNVLGYEYPGKCCPDVGS